MMGFDVGANGLRIVLQRELPVVLRASLRGATRLSSLAHGRGLGDVGLHLVHPGGRRILDAYARFFDLAPDALGISRES